MTAVPAGLALNQYGFPALHWAVEADQRVRFILVEYRKGNAPRWVDLVVGFALGALTSFTIIMFTVSGRLSAVETKLDMHMNQHNGHKKDVP